MRTIRVQMQRNKKIVKSFACSNFYIALFTFVLILPCYAQGDSKNESVNCSKEVFDKKYKTKLTKLRNTNIDFSTQICKQYLAIEEQDVTENINQLIKNLSSTNREVITDYFSDKNFKNDLDNLFYKFREVSILKPAEKKSLGSLKVGKNIDDSSKVEIYFDTLPIESRIILPSHINCVQIDSISYNSCEEAFDDISMAFNTYREHYNDYVTDKNKVLLEDMSLDWKRFVNKARNQTLLDVWATTTINSGHYKKDHLVSPATTQYFFLHPGLVYEHVSAAPVGEKDKISIAMEWIGINWWDLKVPVGLSWVSTYSDRAEVSSVGQGVMIYVDNKYSLGWTYRKQGNGIFFSLDILKLFSNKKQQFEQYKNMF
ncbi:MAG: hypothetical protein GQ474_01715 [Sulfurimonas sp.]|nr:hypothetical protein [Sulfurimonas sp.]